jgi:hypothetical protein
MTLLGWALPFNFTQNVSVVYVLLDEQFPDVSKDRNTRMAAKNEGMRTQFCHGVSN